MATGIHRRYFTTGDYGGFSLLAGKRKQTEASLESSSFICVRMGIDRTGKIILIRIRLSLYQIYSVVQQRKVCVDVLGGRKLTGKTM